MKKFICLLLMFFSIVTTGIGKVSAVGDQEFIEIIKEKFQDQNANDYITIDFDYNFDSREYRYTNFANWIKQNFNNIDGFENKILSLSNNGQNQIVVSKNPLESWIFALFIMCSNIDSRINNSRMHGGVLEYYLKEEYIRSFCKDAGVPLNESVYRICNGFWRVCNEVKPLIDKLYNDKKEVCEANMKSLERFFERINS